MLAPATGAGNEPVAAPTRLKPAELITVNWVPQPGGPDYQRIGNIDIGPAFGNMKGYPSSSPCVCA